MQAHVLGNSKVLARPYLMISDCFIYMLLVPTWNTMLLKLVVVVCAWVPCFSLRDASTIRLASMLETLAPGKRQTVAGDPSLTLCVMESPITSVGCLTLTAEVQEAGKPTGLPTGLVSPVGSCCLLSGLWATQPVACSCNPVNRLS